MLFKSVRSFSRSCARFSLAAIFLGGSSAWALTVTPISLNNTVLNNSDGYTAYYPYKNTTQTLPLPGLDTGDSSVPVAVDGTYYGGNDSSGANAIYFRLYSPTTTFNPPANTTATYHTYVMAFVTTPSNSSTLYAVPISWHTTSPGNGVTPCYYNNGSGCSFAGTTTQNGVNYDFAVPYTPTQTLQIGIYPADICNLYGGSGFFNSATPCSTNGTSFADITTNNNSGFKLTFYIVMLPDSMVTAGLDALHTTQSALSSANPAATFPESATLNLSFQPNGGTLLSDSCPSGTTLNSTYFPGDQQIFLNTTLFSNLYQIPTATTTTSGSFAKSNYLVILSNSSSTYNTNTYADETQTGFSSSVLARTSIGPTDATVYPFTNSTSTSQTYYNLSILPRDYAGFVASLAVGKTACRIPNVQTAEIQGFLKESKCFIATAAFRSMDAAPVVMLRKFRDEVLLQFSLGESFVHWYYRWSPPAAEWLLEHPGFRYPVLLALVPVQILAWLCLRPLIFLLLFGASLTMILLFKNRAQNIVKGEPL